MWQGNILPSVLAAVWHNIAGPILATFWSKKPADILQRKSIQTSVERGDVPILNIF
ncbi:hypothetical protein [Bacillus cereus]|uniref:hypothetical protein n=1 Tax=Bacillus cereus TaxID=1396 RepID=UPI0015967B84